MCVCVCVCCRFLTETDFLQLSRLNKKTSRFFTVPRLCTSREHHLAQKERLFSHDAFVSCAKRLRLQFELCRLCKFSENCVRHCACSDPREAPSVSGRHLRSVRALITSASAPLPAERETLHRRPGAALNAAFICPSAGAITLSLREVLE